jgi:hypothetical protein
MLVSITCKYGARQGVIFQLRPNTHQRHPATVALPTSQCAHSCVPLRVRVKSTSLNLRFSDRIGFASGERKNGPPFSPPEKMLQSCVVACRRPLSLVRFASVNLGIAAILAIFGADRGISLYFRLYGGESGIRTHVTLSSKHAFQACAFSHSAISPA